MKLRRFALAAAPLLSLAASFLGCRQIAGVDDPVACTSDDSCTTEDQPCVAGECVDGYCAYAVREAGTVIDTAEAQDCTSHVCNESGEVVAAVAADDAPSDDTVGDCAVPVCDDQGNVISAPSDTDAPTGGTPGDCAAPGCVDGAPADVVDDADVPPDTTAGDCESPGCDAGQIVTVANPADTPGQDTDGDCLAPACVATGGVEVDDTDTPTSGCGGCANGVVVPWAEETMACYTGALGTQNVVPCVGGTWACDNNVKVCSGEIIPGQEQCGPGFSGVDDDCDGSTDEDGPGCSCMLGMTQACYTGPAPTQNVGICDDGLSTCMVIMSSNQYGPCASEVLPQTCDSCLVGGDQDCSGSADTCTGSHVWSKAFGNASSDTFFSVAENPDGTAFALGTFSGTLTAGNTITSDGLSDVALLKLDADGNAINLREYGGTGGDAAGQVISMDDGFLITGTLGNGSGETFGTGSTLTAVGNDGFIAKYSPNQTLLWKKLIGGTMSEKITGVAKMPDNGVVVVGQFPGTLNVGGSNLTSLGFDDIFVARFDQDGNHVWSKRFGDNMTNNVNDVTVAPNGDIILVGEFGTSANFGGATINAVGGNDAYIARLDQNGNHLTTRAFQSAGNEYASRVGATSDGSVWIVGAFDTAVNVNGVAGADVSPTGTGQDILMVKYDATGNYLTSRAVNGTATLSIRDLSIGFDDGVTIVGSYTGTLYFNPIGFTLPSFGGNDAFIFKTGPTGTLQWFRKPGDTGSDVLFGVHSGACGDVLAVGNFTNNVNFGGGALPNAGSTDMVVARYRQ